MTFDRRLPPAPPPLPTAQSKQQRKTPPNPPPPPPPPPPPRAEQEADESAASHVGGDGAELHGVLPGLGARLRGHRPHPHPPPPGLLLLLSRRPRPQARRLPRRPPVALPRRRRSSAGTQGAGGGVAAREVVPQERARGRLGQGGGAARQVRQGGRRRRAVPAQGEPARLRRLRPPHPRAPGQVLLPLHNQEVRQRRDQAGGRGERHGVRAHLRGQGRRLDARRRRTVEDVCGSLPTHSSHEELRGCQLSTESCPMKHTAWPLRTRLPERRRKLCSAEVLHVR